MPSRPFPAFPVARKRAPPIVIRFHWSRIHSATPHFEQAFSAGEGKTWEVNWITEQTTVGAEPN